MLALLGFLGTAAVAQGRVFPKHDSPDLEALVDIHALNHQHRTVTAAELAGSGRKVDHFKIVNDEGAGLDHKLREHFESGDAVSFLETGVPQIPDPISCVCKLLDGGDAGEDGEDDQSLLEVNAQVKSLTPDQRRRPPAFEFQSHPYQCVEQFDGVACDLVT